MCFGPLYLGLYFELPLALGDLPLTVTALSFDIFLHLCVSPEPSSLTCCSWGNTWGVRYYFYCSTAEGREGNPPSTSVVGSTLSSMVTRPYRALACLLCAKRGHGHHSTRAGGQMLERAFPSGRRRDRAHLCVSAAPHRALTPLTLCTPCFSAG